MSNTDLTNKSGVIRCACGRFTVFLNYLNGVYFANINPLQEPFYCISNNFAVVRENVDI
jgi:hypothetical protein